VYGISNLTQMGETQFKMLTAAYVEQFYNEEGRGTDAIQNVIFDVAASIDITSVEPPPTRRRELRTRSLQSDILVITFTMNFSYRSFSDDVDAKTVSERPFLEKHMKAEYIQFLHDNNAAKFVGNIYDVTSIFRGDDFPELNYTPVQEEDTPVEEENTPVEVQDTPVEEENSPVEEENTPVGEENSPVEDEDTPFEEENTPVEVQDTPVEDENNPFEEETTAETNTPSRTPMAAATPTPTLEATPEATPAFTAMPLTSSPSLSPVFPTLLPTYNLPTYNPSPTPSWGLSNPPTLRPTKPRTNNKPTPGQVVHTYSPVKQVKYTFSPVAYRRDE
jgi:hypothetical protein